MDFQKYKRIVKLKIMNTQGLEQDSEIEVFSSCFYALNNEIGSLCSV